VAAALPCCFAEAIYASWINHALLASNAFVAAETFAYTWQYALSVNAAFRADGFFAILAAPSRKADFLTFVTAIIVAKVVVTRRAPHSAG
jgi:hypothetical protein